MSKKHAVDAEHPAKPDSVTDISKPSWGYTLRKTVREFMDDDCMDLAAALTYYAVLSLFPALIALASILALVGQGNTTQTIVDTASEFVPKDTMEQLRPIIDNITSTDAPGIGLVLGLLVALWTASNYVNAFSRAMNRMYEVAEGRPIWKLRPVMYLLTLVMLILVAIAGVILAVSGPIAKTVFGLIGLKRRRPDRLEHRQVAGAAAHRRGRHRPALLRDPQREAAQVPLDQHRAVIAIVIAGLAALALGLYVSSDLASYNKTYGALAGVIIFLLLLWIVNLALLFGAEFDAELERARQLQAGIPAEETVQLPPRDTKASDKKAKKAQEDIERGRALRVSRGQTTDLDAVDDVALPSDGSPSRTDEARHR